MLLFVSDLIQGIRNFGQGQRTAGRKQGVTLTVESLEELSLPAPLLARGGHHGARRHHGHGKHHGGRLVIMPMPADDQQAAVQAPTAPARNAAHTGSQQAQPATSSTNSQTRSTNSTTTNNDAATALALLLVLDYLSQGSSQSSGSSSSGYYSSGSGSTWGSQMADQNWNYFSNHQSQYEPFGL